MANFNKVILAGNLTRDPQLTYLPNNTPVAEFGLAINRRWRAQDGQLRDETCFVDCSCFGKQAETLNTYMKKGRPLLVEGRLKFDQWESKEGQKRSRLRVVVDSFQFLGDRRDSGAPAPAPGAAQNAAVPAGAAYAATHEYADAPPPAEDPGPAAATAGGEHIPF